MLANLLRMPLCGRTAPQPLLNDTKYRDWSFPGDKVGLAQRQPETWQEMAYVICKILQNRADAQAPTRYDSSFKLKDTPPPPYPHENPRAPKKQKTQKAEQLRKRNK